MNVTQALFFTGNRKVEIREHPLRTLDPQEILVQTKLSGISAGTEMLVYRGQIPEMLALDETIQSLEGKFSYPVQYGYCAVGEVQQTGSAVDPSWNGQRVFAFQPHQADFITSPEQVLRLPDKVSDEAALFLPNMETAATIVHDAAPLLDERVLVFGQGVVGLNVTAILSHFPLEQLICIDPAAQRREIALEWGATHCFDPSDTQFDEQLGALLGPSLADLCIEVSGTPAALQLAIRHSGFDGRIVVGSWYGSKPVILDLGSEFHRRRQRLFSSQVSTISPKLQGRWTKSRRYNLALKLIESISPQVLITHRFKLENAHQAYDVLDRQQEDAIQVILEYDS